VSFARSLAAILALEGGEVNDPDDPGGATSRGITQGRYDGFCRQHGRPKKPVPTLTAGEVEHFYRMAPWAAVRGDALPWPVNLIAFDAAVNQGEGYAPKLVQWAVGVKQDGVIGPATAAAVKEWEPYWLATRMLWARAHRYVATCRLWEKNGKARPWKYLYGWMNRVAEMRRFASLEEHGHAAA